MIKLLAYTDGKPHSRRALLFAAELTRRLGAELSVMTVRSGTAPTEEPPPVGVAIDRDHMGSLIGLRTLLDALEILSGSGLLQEPESLTIRDTPHGYMFVCKTAAGSRVPFYQAFGPFVEAINGVVDRQGQELLIISPPRRSAIRRLVAGDTTRKLLLGLRASLLIVRNGGPDSRYLICLNRSPSSRSQFPILRRLLPAITQPVDLICISKPDDTDDHARADMECLQHAAAWLEKCGRKGTLLRKQGVGRAELITQAAGAHRVIVMGASLRHDVLRRMLGSLPMQVLARTDSSVLVIKRLPEADTDFLKDPLSCG